MTTTTHTTIPEKKAQSLAGHLQDTLVDLIDLALVSKQAHWNVVGPHFKPVHEHLDEIEAEVRTMVDDIAERLVALGVAADGRAATVARDSKIEAYPSGFVRDKEAVAALVERVVGVIGRLRERIEPLEADPVTQDFLIQCTQGLEKQLWMLRSQVE